MSIVQSLILGVVQGLGEFLPISSSGHLLLCRIFLGIQTDTPAMKMLDILLHVGTLLPVLIVFRKEWIDVSGEERITVPEDCAKIDVTS